VAVCARLREGARLAEPPGALLARLADGRMLGLLPLAPGGLDSEALVAELAAGATSIGLSAPRDEPAGLHEALREAELLAELLAGPDSMLPGQEETYRLLIRVLLRDPAQLQQLRADTVSALERYDAEHVTELLATLRAFLAHHGSTTDTAEAMSLHRHTVGYRLARVHEVSGLSPYESDGRERLSLGLKAHQILEADQQRSTPK
jgi:purine catabolism regulator